MTKLVTHLGHFPMGGGAAQLNSNVLESDDSDTLEGAELVSEIFNAPNTQVRTHQSRVQLRYKTFICTPGHNLG